MDVKYEFDGVPKKINKICKNDRVGLFAAQTLERYMNPYVPMDTGMLMSNTTISPFRIQYNQPYAQRCFYGIHFKFHKDMHPLATARWDIAVKTARGNQIANEVSRFIGTL